MDHQESIRAQRVAWAVVALILMGFGLWTLREFLPALIWASILTIAFWPLFQRARRTWPPGHHNILLPLVFTLGIALVFVLPIVLAGMRVGHEARSLLAWIESARQDGLPVPDLVTHLPFIADTATTWWRDNLSDPDAASELFKRLKNPEFVLAGREFGVALLHRAVVFGFCLMTMFFLFKDGDTLAEQMRRASVRALGPVGDRIGRQIIASVHGTVDGLVLVGLAEGALLYVVYLFTGVPHPSLLGAATAVGAMIPFGAPVAFFIAAALSAAGGTMANAIVIIVLGMVISFVADHFVRPVLIGGATKLPFIWVLFGILGGVASWGLLGLFIGPAIMAVLMLLWREWTESP
jgi:predicted PurR-regulated permease PerM